MKRIVLMFLFLGMFLNGYSTNEGSIITLKDTIVKLFTPPLNRENLTKELIKRNIPCYEIVVAQALHESGNFKSRICRERNNIFGMKTRKGYKYYKSWIECVEDYENKFSKRYKGGDYFKFLIKVNYHESGEYYEQCVRRHLRK